MKDLPLPDFRKGKTWKKTSSQEMQNLVDTVKMLRNMTVTGPGVSYTQTNAGHSIVITPEPMKSTAVQSVLHVVLVVQPEETLEVRQVTYAETDEELGVSLYKWLEDDTITDIQPIFGYDVEDYAPFFWDPTEKGVPTQETFFLKLQLGVEKRKYKVLWYPEGVSRLVVVRAVHPGSHFLTIQTVQRNIQTGVYGLLIPTPGASATYPALTWPNYLSEYYEADVFQGNDLMGAHVLEAQWRRGAWIVKPQLFIIPGTWPSGPFGECQVFQG